MARNTTNTFVLRLNGKNVEISKMDYALNKEKSYRCLYKSPVGLLLIEANEHAITSITRENTAINNSIESNTSVNQNASVLDEAIKELDEYFYGKRQYFDFPMELIGTEFQVRVWRALYDIPFGVTKSYKDIAIAINNPKACRAIGNANNKNPISIAVPCHRVIGADGSLVGYGGGIDMKVKLLMHENINIDE